jgi:hypothetical protein
MSRYFATNNLKTDFRFVSTPTFLRKCRQMADDVVGSSQADLGISLFIHDQ